jgi:enoyl-CoA hydratase/carnithine racemase
VRVWRFLDGGHILVMNLSGHDSQEASPMSPFRGSVPFHEKWEHFRLEREGGIATLTLARPEKLNALTFEGYADLRDLIAELPHRGDTRVLVLKGDGPGFCSGGDVNEIIGPTKDMRPDQQLAFTRMAGEVIKALRECPIPVIASIHGMAAGAGSVLALAADFRVVARSARFAFLFTRVGLSGADMGSAYLLPRVVGLGNATKLLMLGDTISATEADRYGLVSELVDDEELETATQKPAARLADGPAFAYAQTKMLLTRQLDMGLSAAIEMDAATQALLMNTDDYAEFHSAFTAKRRPEWKGR